MQDPLAATTSETEREVWAAIDAANDAWVSGRPRDVAALYADDATLIAPDLTTVIVGLAGIVGSYEQYVNQATTDDFTVTARHVHIRDDLAVATYRFMVTYRIGDATYHQAGQEVLVLGRGDSRWVVVWRTQIPLSQEAPTA